MINDNKNETEMKNRSHRYDITRPRPRHGHKYAIYNMSQFNMTICINQQYATFEAQFMKNLSNTEAELKKSVAFKKSVQDNWFLEYLDISKAANQRCSSKRCSEIIQQIYRRAPMPKCDFNKIALNIY